MSEEMIVEKPWATLIMTKDTVFQCEDYEERIFTEIEKLGELNTVVDVGAHQGLFTTFLAERSKMVYAFEPHYENYRHLLINTAKYNNVAPIRLGLADIWKTDRFASWDTTIDGTTGRHGSVYYDDNVLKIDMEFAPLDDVLHEDITDIDLIKIDVDGWEYLVVKGAKRIIADMKTPTIIETHHDGVTQSIVEWCNSHGLHFKMIDSGIHSLNHTKPFIFINWRGWDEG